MTRKSYSKQFTPEQKAAYHAEQREQAQRRLEAAVSALETSDGFRAWLTMRSKFRGYSFLNTLLIQEQCPHAKLVNKAGYKPDEGWKGLGRWPRKGETGLRIFKPDERWMPCESDEPGARYSERNRRWERKVLRWRLVPVFDVSQTEGADLPPAPTLEPADGDSHAHLIPALVKLAGELGYSVSFVSRVDDYTLRHGASGYCDSTSKAIVVCCDAAPNYQVHILVHEIAHALGIGYKEYGRKTAEVIVDSATYIVLAGQGLDVSAHTVNYVTGRGSESTSDAHAKLQEFAQTIDKTARRIEQALEAAPQPTEELVAA